MEAASHGVDEIKMTTKLAIQSNLLLSALEKLPLCEGSSGQQFERLMSAFEAVLLHPREVVTRAGMPNDYLYVVQAGLVNVTGPGKSERVVRPGQTFGEDTLDLGGVADFTAVSTGNVQVWRLHRRAFKLLQANYGARLRNAVEAVMEQNRAAGTGMAQIAREALAMHRDREALYKTLLSDEFADVPAALRNLKEIGTLGKGAMGEVVLAVHMPTKRSYAVKRQASGGTSGADGVPRRRMIDREIACMREAASPFLMRFYGEHEFAPTPSYVDPKFAAQGSGAAEPMSHMILEFMGGGSLEELQGARGVGSGMDPASVRFYFACALAGLDAMHAAAWMHRDLATKNVVIGNQGYAKLIDVGLAKRVSHTEHTYTTCGTPIYIAPEIIQKVCDRPVRF